MGISAQQHRAATGCYAARLWSSGWTPGSSGRTRSNKVKKRSKKCSYTFRVDIFLMDTLLANTAMMVLVPPTAISTASSLFEIYNQETFSESPCLRTTNTVTNLVNPHTSSMLLLLAGDVEVNPGPQMPEETPYAKSMRLGLASLLVGAPDKVHEVLSVWSSSKPGNEIVNVWSNNTKKFKTADLQSAFAWLSAGSRKGEGKKVEVAEQLLVELETYLPDNCHLCMQEYTVARGTEPSVRCAGCLQGFHEPCLETLGWGSLETPDMVHGTPDGNQHT